jgi:two-component system OmpR family sensor kinase
MSPRGVKPPRGRSLRDKLTLLFFGITAAAFALLYFLVVPELEDNLRDQKLDQLARIADGAQSSFDRLTRDPDITSPDLDRRVESIASAIDARVTLLGIQRSVREGDERVADLYVTSDSRDDERPPFNEELARQAARSGDLAFGEMRWGGEQLAQVAQPLVFDGVPARVVLYSRPLEDVTETVSFVRSRMLLGGTVALLLASIAGAFVAQTLARRVRRLEVAAEDVAAGNYGEPLVDVSEDELGELTRAFNAMQEQLRVVDVARREFIATASHELRTPIFSLGGFVELLRDEELDEAERRDFLEEIAGQVERLQKLAVDLLDLSRLDSGSLALDIDTVDLTEVAELVANEFGPAAGEHGAELGLDLPAGGVAARCDRERVVQIVRILLDNALRHTPPGTRIRLSVGADAAGAAITVSDDGPGVPTDRPIFDRFVTGGASPGAGLGLAIAHELAGRMHGSLRASQNGGGAAFTLELPRAAGG